MYFKEEHLTRNDFTKKNIKKNKNHRYHDNDSSHRRSETQQYNMPQYSLSVVKCVKRINYFAVTKEVKKYYTYAPTE